MWCDPLSTCRQPFARFAAIQGDEATGHAGKETAVLIPVAVILVPLPGPAHERLLEHQLRVVVIDLAAEDLLHGVHDSPRARDHAEEVVAGVVPQREPALAALGVFAAVGVLVQRRGPPAPRGSSVQPLPHRRDFRPSRSRRARIVQLARRKRGECCPVARRFAWLFVLGLQITDWRILYANGGPGNSANGGLCHFCRDLSAWCKTA